MARSTPADGWDTRPHTEFFFDPQGGLWATCDVHHLGAEAFGPTGVARRATPEEANLAVLGGETAHSAAWREWRLNKGEGDEWDTLIA